MSINKRNSYGGKKTVNSRASADLSYDKIFPDID